MMSSAVVEFCKGGWTGRWDRASHHLQQPPRGVTWEICGYYVGNPNLLMAVIFFQRFVFVII